MKKACILTFGCQMNLHDSEWMSAQLENSGFEVISQTKELPEDLDILIINTCSVRDKPEQKLASSLLNFKKYKKSPLKPVIAVSGCVAQQKGRGIMDEFPFVDIVIGPDGVGNLINYYNQVAEGSKHIEHTEFTEHFDYSYTQVTDSTVARSHAYVTAIKGCTNFCSYCIVPFVRGREVSRLIDDIVKDVKKLTAKGISSITLLGQNICRFGMDTGETLPGLLKNVAKIEGIKRLYFLTSHPRDFNEETAKCFDELENILCPMLHLPVQHASNKILKAMNRGYTKEEYLEKIEYLRKLKTYSKMSVTSDVIIGFPGETEEDFEELLQLLEKVEFDNTFSFIYSPRPDTFAYKKYGSSIAEEDRKKYIERLQRYQTIQKRIALEKNKKLLGMVQEVLIEGNSIKDNTKLTGRTRNLKVVNFENAGNNEYKTGDYVMVKIESAHPTHLSGVIVNDN